MLRVSANMSMIEVECMKCKKLFSCVGGSMADRQKLCGDCVTLSCPQCQAVNHLDKIIWFEGLRCFHCGADLGAVLSQGGA